MKNIIAIITLVLCWNISSAQLSLERQLVGSAGYLSPPGAVQASSTTGELMCSSYFGGDLIITQGFQQPDTIIEVGIKSVDDPLARMLVYPNPVRNNVTLDISLKEAMKVGIEIYNQFGQQVGKTTRVNVPDNYRGDMDLSALPAGNYFIVVKSTDGRLYKGFKVQKIN